MSETTQPVHCTVLIPNSHTPCLLNCLLGDHITSLSTVQVPISNFCGDQKKILPLTSALRFPCQGSQHPLPSVKSGSDWAAGVGPASLAGSANAQSSAGGLHEEASDGQGDREGSFPSTIPSLTHVTPKSECISLPPLPL